MTYDQRNGSPYDRGHADYYYGRPPMPHYFTGKTYMSDKVEGAALTNEERKAYFAGYDDAEAEGAQKDWG